MFKKMSLQDEGKNKKMEKNPHFHFGPLNEKI
jgi:hypothetical protein